jgi:1-acyl-sn-glycerol-3-phosphate acyltransferase
MAPPRETATTPEKLGQLVHLPRPAAPSLEDPRRSDVDEWGRSEHMREIARRVYDPMYRHWFRAEWEGLEKIPTDGGALLVANHAAAIPSDAPVIMHGIETELERPCYGLADELFKSMPVVGTMWSRVGGVVAHPDNAYRLLREQQQLVLVFPEGSKGPAKTYNERYQLRRFGRGGFVQIAMRAGVPSCRSRWSGRGVDAHPVQDQRAAPRRWAFRTRRSRPTSSRSGRSSVHPLLPGQVQAAGPRPRPLRRRPRSPPLLAQPGDGSVRSHRQQIQEALYDMLRQRQSVWFG